MTVRHEGEEIKAFLRKNPQILFTDFCKEKKWVKVPRSTFRYYRDIVRKEKDIPNRTYRRSIQKVYTTIWASEECMAQGDIDTIKKFVRELNEEKVVNWEILEIADPARLEVREVTK